MIIFFNEIIKKNNTLNMKLNPPVGGDKLRS